MPSSRPLAERILVIGMMASGKSTVGAIVAERLGWGYVDSDEQIEQRTGRTVREIFEQDGETAFRAEEKAAMEAAVAGSEPLVVGVAGGAVLDLGTRTLLREEGTVVWLRAEPELLAERVKAAGQDHRPLLADDPDGTLRRLDAERRPIYEELADIVVDVEGRTAEELAEHIVQAMAE